MLVEDDAPLAASIAGALQAQGWRVDISARGEPVPLSLARDAYDALVLDIGLPGIDGLETLRRVRAAGQHLPVLMLTARDSLEDRVLGLETGADDYLVKPFAPVELVARLRALTRRHENREAGQLRLARLRYDPQAQRAAIGDEPLHLSQRESVLLQYLMHQAERIVARDQLLALLPAASGTPSDNALELLISRLRGKIEPAGVRLRTVRGLGYLLQVDGG
ncbi:response regulator transcription factor [Piscinibacter sakaiensis]|uniref:response regulator transcription factor n=1 Tax=Piscinibacter sakaiensis TaxID=1547922 RepID=UPI00372B0835